MEIFLIFIYGRRDLKTGTLCNLTEGGNGAVGRKLTEEHKKKISISTKGKIISDNHKAIISFHHKGKILSEETKRKIIETKKNKKLLKPIIKKEAKFTKGRSKIVLDIEMGIFYYSILEASEAFNIKFKTLSNQLIRNINKTNLRYV